MTFNSLYCYPRLRQLPITTGGITFEEFVRRCTNSALAARVHSALAWFGASRRDTATIFICTLGARVIRSGKTSSVFLTRCLATRLAAVEGVFLSINLVNLVSLAYGPTILARTLTPLVGHSRIALVFNFGCMTYTTSSSGLMYTSVLTRRMFCLKRCAGEFDRIDVQVEVQILNR